MAMSCTEASRAWADLALSSALCLIRARQSDDSILVLPTRSALPGRSPGIPSMRNGFNLSLTKLNQQVKQRTIRYAG